MFFINEDYYLLVIFFLFALFLSVILFALSYFVAYQAGYTEKLSTYECGFDPFDDARGTFDVRFYLVAILFLLFDLEVIFLYPWFLVFSFLSFYSFWVVFTFLVILTFGFFYEWRKGALEWE
jgi:NADH-quinone oxidoreductase subunit A